MKKKGKLFPTEEFQGRNEGDRKPSLEHQNNNYCKQDPLMNAKMSEQGICTVLKYLPHR